MCLTDVDGHLNGNRIALHADWRRFALQVGIMPENGEDVIGRAAAILGYPLDTVFRLSVPEGVQSTLAAPFTGEVPLLLVDLLSKGHMQTQTAVSAAGTGSHGLPCLTVSIMQSA